MPQLQFPFFPDGMTHITPNIGFKKEAGKIYYFCGNMPVFSHAEDDYNSFRLFISQLYVNGSATQAEISKAFGVTSISVKRAVKVYREKGSAGFFVSPPRRGPTVLTPDVLSEVQKLLDRGIEISAIAQEHHLKKDTLKKAIKAGRLHQSKKKSENLLEVSTKSERTAVDADAPMGMGATNIMERVSASIHQGKSAIISFRPAMDVPNGGVLLALPALLATGLLSHANNFFRIPPGYYGLDSIFLLLAFMALARVKSIESLRYCPPGEWGKLLGLDRIPEVRTLREKLANITLVNKVTEWMSQLWSHWMADMKSALAVFYIDGHVRVYYGEQTKLPHHYVARQKLCLRATTDYWVNARDGQPILVINKPIDPGLLKVLEHDIVPRLEKEFPPVTLEEVVKNPKFHRFTLIFDREGYSPQFLLAMKQRHIACLTYHKHQGTDWREGEFTCCQIRTVGGNIVEMQLAERGIFLSNKLWLREIRKLSEGGHQTSILTTDYVSTMEEIAPSMFARWSQENFFKYMRENYSLDRLVDYETDSVPDTTQVVNPQYRTISSEIRKKTTILNRTLAKFGSVNLKGEITPKKVTEYQQEKAQLQEKIAIYQADIERLKIDRKAFPTHISFSALPKEDQFKQLSIQSKHFIDTIKMIAYRAETAMVQVLREVTSQQDQARRLVKGVYDTEADLVPDEKEKTLTVFLHNLPSHSADKSVQHLCEEMNKTETIFPGTNFRLIYKMGSGLNPRLPEFCD